MIITMNSEMLFEYIVELTLYITPCPRSHKKAHRRLHRAWEKLPSDVREAIAAEVSRRWDEIVGSIPRIGKLND